MNKIFNSKQYYNVFDLWKKVQIKLSLIQAQILNEKKQEASQLLEKFELIFSKIKPISNDEFMYDNNIFVALIKYLMESNNFFDTRLDDDQIDEMLLLAYVYEWLCLEKTKDVTLLGDRGEVLRKLRYVSNKSNSANKKIFENLDIDDISNLMELKRRVKSAVMLSFNEMIMFIFNDQRIYKKILNETIKQKNFDNQKQTMELWNQIFQIEDKNFIYSYSVDDSDSKIIYINVFNKDQKIAYVKYKMFYTYSIEAKQLKPTGISKEMIRIELIDEHANSMFGTIVSNCLKIANRVIKNIFLLDLQIKNDEQEQDKINNLKSKKVVKIFKMHAKSEEKEKNDYKNNLIKKSLG